MVDGGRLLQVVVAGVHEQPPEEIRPRHVVHGILFGRDCACHHLGIHVVREHLQQTRHRNIALLHPAIQHCSNQQTRYSNVYSIVTSNDYHNVQPTTSSSLQCMKKVSNSIA